MQTPRRAQRVPQPVRSGEDQWACLSHLSVSVSIKGPRAGRPPPGRARVRQLGPEVVARRLSSVLDDGDRRPFPARRETGPALRSSRRMRPPQGPIDRARRYGLRWCRASVESGSDVALAQPCERLVPKTSVPLFGCPTSAHSGLGSVRTYPTCSCSAWLPAWGALYASSVTLALVGRADSLHRPQARCSSSPIPPSCCRASRATSHLRGPTRCARVVPGVNIRSLSWRL